MRTSRTRCTFGVALLALFLAGTAFSQVKNECTGEESWLPVGTGVAGEVFATTEMNGDLYVLHQVPGSNPQDNNNFAISRWNGAAWSAVTAMEMEPTGRWEPFISAFEAYNGSLYVGGGFSSINGNSDLATLARWDGTTWSSARGNTSIMSVTALEVHQGNLYAAVSPSGRGTGRVMEWNGTDWTYVGGEASQENNYSGIATMMSWNGDLYVAGYSLAIGGMQNQALVKWDGNAWSSLGNNLKGYANSMAVYNNQLYIGGSGLNLGSGNSQIILRWDGTAWDGNFQMPSGIGNRDFKFAVHNNMLYMLSGLDSIPEGIAMGYTNLDRFDGNAWHDVSNANGALHVLTTYNGDLLLGGNFTESCGTPLANIAYLCDDQNCGKISGTVYHDANGNCAQDQGERGLPRRIVEIAPGGQYAVTDENGNYSRFVEDGSYAVGLRTYGYWNTLCPAPPGTYSVTITSSSSSAGNNFGTVPTPNIQDLRVSAVAGRARQGRQLVYAITYENVGTVPMNGTVRFHHDPILMFDSSQGAPSRYTPNVIEWDFVNLEVDEIRTITVWTTVPIGTPMGTDICSRVDIDPSNNGVSLDDRDSVCVPVTGGYDPNDIQVTPFGVEDNGVITPQDSVLTYWVRFQNTGNDTAFKVVVVDELSAMLDISSIKLGASSHPFSFSIDKNNALVWTFNDIMLPDSNANETNSHGFFKFSVKLKPSQPLGTEIPNQVRIYFDYNPPVATNTVVSIIGASMGVDEPAADNALAIYPNPARDQVRISAELRNGSLLTLRNLLGQSVREYRHDGSRAMTIDLRDLPAGTYLLTVETAQGIKTERVTVVR